jgi:hypothetical protein
VEGATVTLSDGLLLSRDLTVPAGVTIDLTSAGRFHMRNATLTVNVTVNAGAGHVSLEDMASEATINGNWNVASTKLTLDGVTLVGLEDNSEALVYVGLGGQVVMKSGAITGNTHAGNDWVYGGGVEIREGGTFTMEGGTISGNTAQYGGGVRIDQSTFVLEDGRIQGGMDNDGFTKNTASSGAALSLDSSTATWGTGGAYTKGGAAQTGGSDIGDSDDTLIAIGNLQ